MAQHLSKSTHTLVISYLGVRRAIGAVGLLLPVLLGPVGWLVFGVEIQDNMSSYYHTRLRDVFVGALCTIGVFLFCYRGYDWIESWTANFGCLSALGLALFPLDADSDPLHQRSVVGWLHTVSGGAFFLTLAFYSLYHFPSSRAEKREVAPHEAERNFVYRASGVVILLSLIAMGAYLVPHPGGMETSLQRLQLPVLDGVGRRLGVRGRMAHQGPCHPRRDRGGPAGVAGPTPAEE